MADRAKQTDGSPSRKATQAMHAVGTVAAVAVFAVLLYILISMLRKKKPLRTRHKAIAANKKAKVTWASPIATAVEPMPEPSSDGSSGGSASSEAPAGSGNALMMDIERPGNAIMVDAEFDDASVGPAAWGTKTMLQSIFTTWSEE